jgi:hypothetical protein
VASLSLQSCPDFARAKELLRKAVPNGLEIEEALGQVSVLGVGIGSEPALVAKALETLPEAPLAFTSTPLRTSAVLPERALLDAERAWHATFVGAERQGVAA